LLALRKQIDDLQEKLRQVGLNEPVGIDQLSNGNDSFSIEFSFETKTPKIGKNGATYWTKGDEYDHSFESTWDHIFSYLAPDLISRATEYRVIRRLNDYIWSNNQNYFNTKFIDLKIENVTIYSSSFDTIKIQLRALKLVTIEEGDYWALSLYGDSYMTKLLAIHKA
jgi:hypothetical protein